MRGGRRTGAGRPPGTGKYGEPTKAVRLPISLVGSLQGILDDWKRLPLQQRHQIELHYVRPDGISNGSQGVPLYMEAVAAGAPAPATDQMEGILDLNQYLVRDPKSTFCVRVNGDSMIEAGIHPGDLLIVDRKLKEKEGRIAIAVVNGELTVKRMHWEGEKLYLMPENPNYKPIAVPEEASIHIWGIVTNVVREMR